MGRGGEYHLAGEAAHRRARYQTEGRTYQVQVRFTPTNGDAYMAALYELQAVEVLGELTPVAKRSFERRLSEH